VPDPPRLEQTPQQFLDHADFLLPVFNDVLLVAIHPTATQMIENANGFIAQSFQSLSQMASTG
jgi:hypothetical protein